MCAGFCVERNRDAELRGAGLELVSVWIKKGRLRWFGHGDTLHYIGLTGYWINGLLD